MRAFRLKAEWISTATGRISTSYFSVGIVVSVSFLSVNLNKPAFGDVPDGWHKHWPSFRVDNAAVSDVMDDIQTRR
jgi:hypothetical protein